MPRRQAISNTTVFPLGFSIEQRQNAAPEYVNFLFEGKYFFRLILLLTYPILNKNKFDYFFRRLAIFKELLQLF